MEKVLMSKGKELLLLKLSQVQNIFLMLHMKKESLADLGRHQRLVGSPGQGLLYWNKDHTQVLMFYFILCFYNIVGGNLVSWHGKEKGKRLWLDLMLRLNIVLWRFGRIEQVLFGCIVTSYLSSNEQLLTFSFTKSLKGPLVEFIYNKLVLSIIDDFSRMTWVYSLKKNKKFFEYSRSLKPLSRNKVGNI
ncbi:hypothetical protein CR513_09743, partial [Mucuna pruriens]